ncbi:MAG: hypothetical protein K0V04_39525 [Deltaproteobacteria bacterium]|nr:hypothetical protein [Deltaproteobacteria bacterium]
MKAPRFTRRLLALVVLTTACNPAAPEDAAQAPVPDVDRGPAVRAQSPSASAAPQSARGTDTHAQPSRSGSTLCIHALRRHLVETVGVEQDAVRLHGEMASPPPTAQRFCLGSYQRDGTTTLVVAHGNDTVTMLHEMAIEGSPTLEEASPRLYTVELAARTAAAVVERRLVGAVPMVQSTLFVVGPPDGDTEVGPLQQVLDVRTAVAPSPIVSAQPDAKVRLGPWADNGPRPIDVEVVDRTGTPLGERQRYLWHATRYQAAQ